MQIPSVPDAVDWKRVFQLEVEHFTRTDARSEALATLAGALGEPWPWGFLEARIDETALAAGELRMHCAGVFPDGTWFAPSVLSRKLPDADAEGGRASAFALEREEADAGPALRESDGGCAERRLPAARLVAHRGVWAADPSWSPPAMLAGPEHPLRADALEALGGLAALAAGFMTTLRMPAAEERAAARRLASVATMLVQGVGMLEAHLDAPWVTPGRLGLEARRLALGVRAAAGVFDPLAERWDPSDQRGSLRAVLASAQATAEGLGLPFRAHVLRRESAGETLETSGLPEGDLTMGVEVARPSDLLVARSWFEGAVIAAPGKIEEAMNRRVVGCRREALARDARSGVTSGPLLALYRVRDDAAWRAGAGRIGLGANTPTPRGASFLVFVPEEEAAGQGSAGAAPRGRSARARAAHWAGGSDRQ